MKWFNKLTLNISRHKTMIKDLEKTFGANDIISDIYRCII